MVSNLVAAAPRQVRAVRRSFFSVRSPLLWLCSRFVASLVYSSLRNQGHAAAGNLTVVLDRFTAHQTALVLVGKFLRFHLVSLSQSFADVVRDYFVGLLPRPVAFRRKGAGCFRRNGASERRLIRGSNGDQESLFLPPFASADLLLSGIGRGTR